MLEEQLPTKGRHKNQAKEEANSPTRELFEMELGMKVAVWKWFCGIISTWNCMFKFVYLNECVFSSEEWEFYVACH